MNPPTDPPTGCSADMDPLYYKLCDLEAVWGVVVEALAAAGLLSCVVLLVVQLASLPFVPDATRRSMSLLQASVIVFTLGLFGLSVAFVVGRDYSTCVARRFLFGVLYAGCFSCLLMHGLWLVLLERGEGGRGPRGWLLWLGAMALWLVEVVINTEWLIITTAHNQLGGGGGGGGGDGGGVVATTPELSCLITNKDFVMALIYVMVLLVALVLMAVPSLTHKHRKLRRDAVYILLAGVLSMAVWVTWIVMYLHGNRIVGDATWDDPTLAIALVANAWFFLVLYTIPGICQLNDVTQSQEEHEHEDHLYPTRGAVYENILRDQAEAKQNMYMENKAFSMDEPRKALRPVSPYGGPNGQLRSAVYQPTELALMTKDLGKKDFPRDSAIPRASATTSVQGSSSGVGGGGGSNPGSIPRPRMGLPLVGMATTTAIPTNRHFYNASD